MRLLSIDTSTDYLNIAVTRDGRIVSRIHRKMPMMHSTMLVPMIARCLKKAGSGMRDLDGFCVSVGPGSFTGLRIGVTTVKGLSYATGKPVVAVPTLDAIAYNAASHHGMICPILDARKGKVYGSIYKSDGRAIRRVSGYLLVPLVELMERLNRYDDLLILGDMADKVAPARSMKIFKGSWYPKAEIIAKIGSELFRRKRFVTASNLEPLYIYSRECDIKGY